MLNCRWNAKPPAGTPVDPYGPFAAGLIGAWPINEGTGLATHNALNPNLYVGVLGTGSASPTWGGGPRGGSLTTVAANSQIVNHSLIAPISGATAGTIFALGNRASGKNWTVGRTGGGGQRFELLVYSDNNAYFYSERTSGTGAYGVCAATGATGDFSIAQVFDGTQSAQAYGQLGYLNGVAQSLTFLGGWSAPVSLYTGVNTWRVGYEQAANVYSDGRFDLVLLWIGRALSAVEIAELHSNPWQVFQPPAPYQLYHSIRPTGQRTPILSTSVAPPTAAGANYRPLCDNTSAQTGSYSAWNATVGDMWQPCPIAGTVDYLLLNSQSAMSGNYAFTLMKSSNGNVSSTSLTATPGGTTGGDTSHAVAFSPGDLFCMQCVTGAGASGIGTVSWQVRFTAPNANQSLVLGGMAFGVTNTAVNYGTLQGCAGQGGGANGPFECQPCAGTYLNLYVYVPTSVATGSWSVAVESGAVGSVAASALSATITSGQIGSDTTHSLSVTPGQLVGTALTPSGTPTAQVTIFWGVEFDPSSGNQSIGTYDITPFATGQTAYNGVSGTDCDVTGSQTSTQTVIMGGFRVQNMSVVNAVPATSGTVPFTVYRNGSATSITATIAVSTTGASDTSDSFATADYDLLGVQTVNSTSGTIYPCFGITFAPTVFRRTLFDRAGSRGSV